jgi:hypothetical protein
MDENTALIEVIVLAEPMSLGVPPVAVVTLYCVPLDTTPEMYMYLLPLSVYSIS